MKADYKEERKTIVFKSSIDYSFIKNEPPFQELALKLPKTI